MHDSIALLRAEHRSIATLLRGARALVTRARERGETPDFDLLRAVLFYLAEFPERHHHRRESLGLFPRVRARAPLVRHVLDHLEEDHVRGDACLRELAHALTAFQLLGEPRRAAFETLLARYVDFQRSHMALEEDEIFPLALHVLCERDWRELAAEFAAPPDPSTGGMPDADYRGLFGRLRPLLPASA
jgi:hemerythrin-like domain-containing protein